MTSARPTFFIPHGGGPCFFMEWDPPETWKKMQSWLAGFGTSVGRPKAILVISSHWEEDEFTVSSGSHPSLIFDYSGFPKETYELTYPAPGDPVLAAKVVDLLRAAGITALTDPARGFDHGVFIPFKVIYPDADVPIVQLSLKTGLVPSEHLAVGKALAALREDDVLIIGSGMSYHNLREFFSGGREAADNSDLFNGWLDVTVTASPSERDERLKNWSKAPAARKAHPREEHLLPLMVVAGAAKTGAGRNIFQDRVMGATISAYALGE